MAPDIYPAELLRKDRKKLIMTNSLLAGTENKNRGHVSNVFRFVASTLFGGRIGF